jgi:hypothetical protein
MMEWPFPWECGKLQWRTQLKESGLIQVKKALEDFIGRIRQLQMETAQAGSDQQLNSVLQGAEEDLKLVDRWMGFCK